MMLILLSPISMSVLLLALILRCHAEDYWSAAPRNKHPDGEVVKVNIIYRHGHKEYKSSFPKDPHKNSLTWTQGPNQLTKLGKQQAHFLGQNLRRRYLHLIPDDTPSWKTVMSYSSDSARTLMSSAVVLSGLLPPEEHEKFSYLDWQPVPIYVEHILGSSHLKCARVENLLKQKKIYHHSKESLKLYKFVTQHSGAYVSHPGSIFNIYTCLEIQRQAKMILPMWSYAVYSEMKTEAAKFFYMPHNMELNRLRFGKLLKKITHFNDSRVQHPIKLYCTHDYVVGGLLNALNISLTEPPNFGAAIVIEFRKVRHKYHAQIWYRHGPLDQLIRFPWPGCGIRCPINRLEEVLKPLIPDDWSEECKLFSKTNKSYVNIILVLIILLTAALICITIGYGSFVYDLLRYKINALKRIAPKLKSRGNK